MPDDGVVQDPKLRETFDFYKANVQDPTLFWCVQQPGQLHTCSYCSLIAHLKGTHMQLRNLLD